MAGVYKRKQDRARGKAGKWTVWWLDPAGKQRSKAGFTDKARSVDLANKLEAEARAVREGLVDPDEATRRRSAGRSISEHLGDYRDHLIAKGGTRKHAEHTAGAIRRVLDLGEITTVGTLTLDRIQKALGALADPLGLSARTRNHALAAVKAFAGWLDDTGRIERAPRGLRKLARANEKADRRVVRRALSAEEMARLLAAAEAGEEIEAGRGPRDQLRVAGSLVFLSGPERALLYRLAMATGFRAGELRSLTLASFRLEGDAPSIVLEARDEKAGRGAVQPITREMAAEFRRSLEGRDGTGPVVFVPEKTAKLLRHDLAKADIPYRDVAGNVVDFHALRVSYITNLIRQGVNPKVVQVLARHSTITLTMDVYAKLDDGDVRKALEGE